MGPAPYIRNKRIGGYFAGKISGLGDDEVKDGDFGKLGDMNLDDNGAPFQYMVSSFVINNIWEVILGKNQISKSVDYETFKNLNFPV
jgi:hypothetical protein